MNYTPEKFVATGQANVEAIKDLSTKSYAGLEKLVELNMAAAKALSAESFAHMQAVMDAKDAMQLMALQQSFVQPMPEKSAAYGRHLYAIATEVGAEWTRVFESQFAESKKVLGDAVETLAQNAPAGSEPAVGAFKNAFTMSQNALESVKSSAQSALAQAESNLTTAANQAASAVAAVTKKD